MENTAPNIAVRTFGYHRVRALRRRLPYPSLWAVTFRARVPAACFTDRSQLCRPESLAISRSGRHVVVSNSDGCDIGVFALEVTARGRPVLKLLERIRDEKLFLYAHGAEFSLDDRRVLALGEYDHSLSAVRLADHSSGCVGSAVEWTLSGSAHGLENPADLAIHRGGRWLVVANRMPTGLSVFAQPSPLSLSPPRFRFNLSVEWFNARNLSAPHGVAFSPDGSLLYVTHKPFFQNPEDAGASAVSVFSCSDDCPGNGDLVPMTVFNCGDSRLHHVAAHPFGELVAVTNSRGNVELLRCCGTPPKLVPYCSIPVFRAGEGAKGVAFTADGRHLMISTELHEILFFAVPDWRSATPPRCPEAPL